jgi:hypothetical protein
VKRAAVTIALIAAMVVHTAMTRADPYRDALDKLTVGVPKDVASVIQRRVDCNHWTGEEPYDKARARKIDRAVKQLKCDALEGDEAQLRKRYATDPKVIKALDDAARFLE